DVLRHAVRIPRAIRYRYGRRMGGCNAPCAGTLAYSPTWRRFRHSPRWIWVGYILSAFAFQYLYPYFNRWPELGCRAMFWVGVLPALLVLWIRTGVRESPVWLERQKHLEKSKKKDQISLVRIFRRDQIGTTIQTSILLAAFMFSFYSIMFLSFPTHRLQNIPET